MKYDKSIFQTKLRARAFWATRRTPSRCSSIAATIDSVAQMLNPSMKKLLLQQHTHKRRSKGLSSGHSSDLPASRIASPHEW